MRLENKVAVITGGNSGIGLGIAREFKNQRAKGAIFGRTRETLDTSIEELGSDFIGIQGDVTNLDNLENLFATTREHFGKIDILVVNAGGAVGPGTLGNIKEVSTAAYDRMMDLNLKSVFFTVQKSLPYLDDESSIVLISSIAVHKAFPGMSVYSAAKAGVRSLARSFSAELLERKIKVNVLSPGTIETPVFGKMGLPDDAVSQAKAQFESLIPLSRIGRVSEIGKVAVFLASDDSSFVLGEEIIVDGGVVSH